MKLHEDISFKLSYVVFIMLINVKVPTIVGILTFKKYVKLHAQLSWAWKSFLTLVARSNSLSTNQIVPEEAVWSEFTLSTF